MSAFFDSLLGRIKLSRQARRPAAARPHVRLCLEALDERILPSAGPIINHRIDSDADTKYEILKAGQEGLTAAARPELAFLIPPSTPNLIGPMGKGSTVNLGLGTLTIQTESFNSQTGVMDFTGTFASSNRINLGIPGGDISDNIGAIPVTGHIKIVPSASTWSFGVLAGVPVGFYTTAIDFQGVGDGRVGSLELKEHQQVSFSGSVLRWVSADWPYPLGYAISGSLDIKDTVQNIPVLGTKTFDTSSPVPGVTFAGMDWAAIQFN